MSSSPDWCLQGKSCPFLNRCQQDPSYGRVNDPGRLDALRIASPDLICIITREGFYADMAPGLNASPLADHQNVIGRRVLDVGRPEFANATLHKALQAMDTGEVITWEFKVPNHPNSVFEARFARSHEDECLVLVRDVTEHRGNVQDLEALVRARTEELQLSNDELRQFAYAASHDLREPLLKVRAFGQRLKEKYAEVLDDKGQSYIDVMLNATERMQSLMDDLLSYSRVGRLEDPFEAVDLNKILRSILEDLAIPIEQANARVLAQDLPTVWADRYQMRTVLQNLISNSIKFRHPDRVPLIQFTAQETDEDWVISVSDNGIGFDMAFKDKVFQLFERLHTRFDYPGTGIGLALVKKILDRHQGWIDCEAMPGEGATFHVGLPKRKVD